MRALSCALLLLALALPAFADGTDATPTFDRFVELQKAKRWPEAVRVLEGVGIDTLSREQFARIEKAARSVRDSVTLLKFKSWAELYRQGDDEGFSDAMLELRLDEYARTYRRLGVAPADVMLRAQVALIKGDTTTYLVELSRILHGRGWMVEKYGIARLRELYPSAVRRAVASGDTATAVRLVEVPVWSFDHEQDQAIRLALLWRGDRATVVDYDLRWVFRDGDNRYPLSEHGNPDLVLELGRIGGPDNIRTGRVWADPVLQFFSGDRSGGLARMEAVADSAWGIDWQEQYSDTMQLCMVLAGDLARLSGKPERAMGWYHRVTWLQYDHFVKLFMTKNEGNYDPISRSGYYRTLGVTRQAELMMQQNRHHRAIAEVFALATLDAAVTNNVRSDGVLFSHWKALADAMQARNDSVLAGKLTVPGDRPDSLGYYENDWTEDRAGRVRARRPARMVLEIDHLQRQARAEYLREWQRSADQESARRYAEYKASIIRAAEEVEAAAPVPSSSSRGQAFQFMPSKRNDVCIRCKGRGVLWVGDDIAQSWSYNPTTQSTTDTKVHTSGHMETCTWCRGTGKR